MHLLAQTDIADFAAAALVATAMIGVPTLGWVFLVVDVRRYVRALRARAMIVVNYFAPRHTPYWALRDRPPCLHTLGLTMPCDEQDVMAAYRSKVKDLHPDRGGDMEEFLRLQKHFEQALHLVRQHQSRAPSN